MSSSSSAMRLVQLIVGVTVLKLLLVPTYHSTDFEVHRNWLAITRSLPVSRWYLDETSPWTLDYPPFFAWFERALAVPAAWVDERMVSLAEGLNYAAWTVVFFQRTTVIVTDSVLFLGVACFGNGMAKKRKRDVLYALVILFPGLLIVDHIHFQYNGFLLGILLLSLAALRTGRDLLGGVLFATLVCFKHLFAVAGPFYFVYLLRQYCWPHLERGEKAIWVAVSRFVMLGLLVLSVVGLAFGPFAMLGQLPQVLARLFPFGRGLCHAYWAPNAWALYNLADKILAVILGSAGFPVQSTSGSFTSGLVGHSEKAIHSVLPQVTPRATALLVLASMVPSLARVWRCPKPSEAARWASHVLLCGFLFGWHVHEKAALTAVLPLALVAVESKRDARDFLFLSVVACYSLFPLLFTAPEYPIKVLLLLLYTMVAQAELGQLFQVQQEEHLSSSSPSSWKKASESKVGADFWSGWALLTRLEQTYLLGLFVVEAYGKVAHPLVFGQRLPFLPLMLVSTYCALGFVYSWARQVACALWWEGEAEPSQVSATKED